MPHITIDADFSGGNIQLEELQPNSVRLRQELRDTEGDWFYWAFRVRGAAGQAIRFHFTGSDVIGVRGPAVSLDGGHNWQWLGAGSVPRGQDGSAFCYEFPADADDVLMALCPLYTETHLDTFVARHAHLNLLRRDMLCRSRAGRDVELLRLETPSAPYRVLLTARHHACEAMGSYCLEGIFDAALADDETGRWLRENVSLSAVPFMDKDGVEAGDQGKNRQPYDHNRDYGGELLDSIYPEVRSLRRFAGPWLAKGKTALFMDLHCPWIRGERNEEVYFVGGTNKRSWQRVGAFSELLEKVRCGPLPFLASSNLPYGQEWNVGANVSPRGASFPRKSCAAWAAELPGAHFATTLEVPYANAGGVEVNADSARALGRDLALAIRAYLSGSR